MTYTITLQQLNAAFAVAMPLIVAFVAGLIRQDGFAFWLNELISHAVILVLATVQTLLGGSLGGSGLANFIIVVSIAYGLLSTKFGYEFQNKVQTSTSIFKAPPAPPALTLESIAAVIAQQFQAYMRQQPIDAQPTQQIQAVRTNTPPIGG